jgi:glutathionyl-hydroquinone reductase
MCVLLTLVMHTTHHIIGNTLTLADIRLFVTLVRFDEVYVVYFKTNKARIADYPNLLNYVRDIYQLPGIADTGKRNHLIVHSCVV